MVLKAGYWKTFPWVMMATAVADSYFFNLNRAVIYSELQSRVSGPTSLLTL